MYVKYIHDIDVCDTKKLKLRIPYTTRGKLDRQNIAPLSFENICDKPYVKRPNTCLLLKCGELHGFHGGVPGGVISYFMKYCHKCSGRLTFWVVFITEVIYVQYK